MPKDNEGIEFSSFESAERLVSPEGAELLEIHATLPGVEAIWRDLQDPEVRAVNAWLEETGKAAWKD